MTTYNKPLARPPKVVRDLTATPDLIDCESCGGTGQIVARTPLGKPRRRTCSECGGYGAHQRSGYVTKG